MDGGGNEFLGEVWVGLSDVVAGVGDIFVSCDRGFVDGGFGAGPCLVACGNTVRLLVRM